VPGATRIPTSSGIAVVPSWVSVRADGQLIHLFFFQFVGRFQFLDLHFLRIHLSLDGLVADVQLLFR
jgi:hypothetical protein